MSINSIASNPTVLSEITTSIAENPALSPVVFSLASNLTAQSSSSSIQLANFTLDFENGKTYQWLVSFTAEASAIGYSSLQMVIGGTVATLIRPVALTVAPQSNTVLFIWQSTASGSASVVLNLVPSAGSVATTTNDTLNVLQFRY